MRISEIIRENVNFVKPQFDVEWEEANRYPEFRKIGKQAWIKLASKGRAVTITDASDINNTDAADPSSFKTLDPAKQKRALAQINSDKVELPIVAVYSDGYKELIGGNTRLTAMMAAHGKGTVWQFAVPDEVAVLAESFNQPYPVKVTRSPDGDDYDAGVKLPDGTNMEILFTEHGGIWDMEFHRGGSQDLTGAGDAFRVFATMMEAVKQFIRMENPSVVSFTATKDVPDGQDPESRAKLYTRMVERFADSLGYSAYINDYGDIVEYELVNKKRVSKSVDENFAEDKMGAINIDTALKNTPEEWSEWVRRLPKELAQEFIDERPNPDQEDIDVFTNLRLTSNKPVEISTKALLREPWMRESVSRTPQPVVDAINKRWGTDFKGGAVYDRNPDRYFKYAKMSAATAKPSVMANGDVIFGVGRMIAALLRGDKNIKVWNLKDGVSENFADGKVKGKSRPRRVKRSGASCAGSVTDLRAKAKKYSGERGKMYQWCLNMKAGKQK